MEAAAFIQLKSVFIISVTSLRPQALILTMASLYVQLSRTPADSEDSKTGESVAIKHRPDLFHAPSVVKEQFLYEPKKQHYFHKPETPAPHLHK